MIALSPAIFYIGEPFNPAHDRGICSASFDLWWSWVDGNNEESYYLPIKRTLELRYSIRSKLRESPRPRTFAHALRAYLRFMDYRRRHLRPLIKDPVALFSASWLASRFQMDVIVMIRHPAAFVSSIKVANWRFPFRHWLEQPALMKDLLAPFRAEIEAHERKQREIIDEASLLWNCMHHVIQRYRQTHPEWRFIRHEDISLDPVTGFKGLYEELGLPFTDEIHAAIEDHSAASNPASSVERRHEFKLNSRANIWNWVNRLSSDEIKRIRENVEPLSSLFYSEQEWQDTCRSGI
jgi:hypothetical protein